MRIAISGASSTGKTTLAKALSNHEYLKQKGISFIKSKEREILNEMGFKSMDTMSPMKQLEFQRLFFEWKLSIETNIDNYITDCSFVDVASYYALREISISPEYILSICKEMSLKYNLHIFLPIGLIEFDMDGYRSVESELHKTIHNQILSFYNEWDVKYYTIKTNVLIDRINNAIKFIKVNG